MPDKIQSQPDVSQATTTRRWSVNSLTYSRKGLLGLFFWLLGGDFAWSLKERAVIPVAQLFFKHVGASDLVIGLLVGSLPAALGMIVGPIISMRSDRHRGRWGRRIPFLAFPTPLIVIALIGLACSPYLGGKLQSVFFIPSDLPTITLLTFAFFWVVFELSSVIANTVFTALVNDVVPEAILGRFFGLFRAASLCAGIIFFFFIMSYIETHSFEIFIALALIYGTGFSLMCFKVKEGLYPPPAPRTVGGLEASLESLKIYFKESFGHRYYLIIFLAMTFGMLAQGPVNTFGIFYAKALGVSTADFGKYLAFTYFISLLLSYPLGALADRFHPLRLGLFLTAAYAVTMVAASWAINSTTSFAAAFIFHGVLSGAYLTGTAALGQMLFPKLKFAQFYSAWGIFNAAAYTLLPPLMGALLDTTNHNYRYTFLVGGLIGAAACFAFFVAYRSFIKLGGPENYSPPEGIRFRKTSSTQT